MSRGYKFTLRLATILARWPWLHIYIFSRENLSYTMKMGETLRYTMIERRTVFGEKNTSITVSTSAKNAQIWGW